MLSQNALIVSVKCGIIYILSWHKVLSDIDGSLRIFMVQAQLLKKIILNREKSCLIRFGACGKVNTALEPNLPVILLISIVTLHGLKKELKQGF